MLTPVFCCASLALLVPLLLPPCSDLPRYDVTPPPFLPKPKLFAKDRSRAPLYPILSSLPPHDLTKLVFSPPTLLHERLCNDVLAPLSFICSSTLTQPRYYPLVVPLFPSTASL